MKQNTSLWFVSCTLNVFFSGIVHNFNEEETPQCFTLCVFDLPNITTLFPRLKENIFLYQTLCKDYHKINSFQFHKENIEFWLKFIFENWILQTGKGSQIPWVWTQAVSSAGVFDGACCCRRPQNQPPVRVLHRGAHAEHTLWMSRDKRGCIHINMHSTGTTSYFFLLADKGWCLPAGLRSSHSFDW